MKTIAITIAVATVIGCTSAPYRDSTIVDAQSCNKIFRDQAIFQNGLEEALDICLQSNDCSHVPAMIQVSTPATNRATACITLGHMPPNPKQVLATNNRVVKKLRHFKQQRRL